MRTRVGNRRKSRIGRRCSFRASFSPHADRRQFKYPSHPSTVYSIRCILTPAPACLALARTHTPPAVQSSRSSRAAHPLYQFFADARLVSALDVPRTLAVRPSPRPTLSPFNLPSASPSSSDLLPFEPPPPHTPPNEEGVTYPPTVSSIMSNRAN
jgi:hypothetical protein